MRRYANRSGSSGVVAFDLGEDFIDVKFVGGDVYRYSAEQPGAREVRAMKVLAERGQGLSTFISRHVRERYAAKRSS